MDSIKIRYMHAFVCADICVYSNDLIKCLKIRGREEESTHERHHKWKHKRSRTQQGAAQ